jgi:hypothetical protein
MTHRLRLATVRLDRKSSTLDPAIAVWEYRKLGPPAPETPTCPPLP